MTLPVKPISEIEEKAQVWADDKILILDADSEEARLASKDELKGDKWDQWDPWTPWADWQDWAAATIAVGTTSTLSPWSSATVTNSGTSSAAVFNFGIPKWEKWDQGNPWQDGQDWADGQDGADWNWITSVTSSKVWKTTTVTMNFDEWDPYSFQVQDWADGQWAWDVVWPASSTDWHLAVFDWVTWKLLKDWGAMPAIPTKVSDLDNDSGFITWIDSGDVTTALWYTPADSASLGTAATKNTWTSSWNVPVLDSNWKLANSTLPWVALTDTFTVSTSSDLTSLSSAEQWDLAIVTSENKTYVLSQAPYSTASNWKQILSPTWWVTSVNWQTWAVTVSEFTPWGTATTWYVVKKTASWYEWAAESWAVTSVNGQTWAVTVDEFTPWGTATTGYVVTKTASGYEWKAPTGWIAVDSASPIQLTKIWAGTQAQYEALGSYDSTCVYLTI